MAINEFEYSEAKIKIPKSVALGILNADEIKKYSVINLNHNQKNDKTFSINEILNARKFGVLDYYTICEIDELTVRDCPGYFGHLELTTPVFNINYIQSVLKVLKCVNYYTSKILIDKASIKFQKVISIKNPFLRLSALSSYSESIKIDEMTKEIMPKYACDGTKIFIEMPTFINDRKINPNIIQRAEMMPEKIYEIFKKINKEDCKILGFDNITCRPCWLLVYNLPIPPVYIRPYCKKNIFIKYEDDLTYKLYDIIKVNLRLQNVIVGRRSNNIINHYRNLLMYHVNTYFNNSSSKLPLATQTSGKPIKGIVQRLNGKYGRFRRNLLGKRVDFSARTVITGDTFIKLEDLGVPEIISKKLTIPEIVNRHNIDILSSVVDSTGVNQKANYVIKGFKKRIDLRFKASNSIILLKYGFVIERQLKNGDLVILNRQPSLHKMSMMSHRVRILPKLTFKLNLSITPPYNADFDGDEMNIHIPQSLQCRSESLMIMNAINNIVSPQANRPVLGIVQDSLIAIYSITKKSSLYSKGLFQRIIGSMRTCTNKVISFSTSWNNNWAGKQMYEQILPRMTLLTGSQKYIDGDIMSFNIKEKSLFIQNGFIISGILNKINIGSSPNSIHHIAWIEKKPIVSKQFLDESLLLAKEYILIHGFSISLKDLLLDFKYFSINIDLIRTSLSVWLLISKLYSYNNYYEKASIEKKVKEIQIKYKKVRSKFSEIPSYITNFGIGESNSLDLMLKSGSKGNIINLQQMLFNLGQQSVIDEKGLFFSKERNFQHTPRYNVSIILSGYILNSFLKGLLPHEFFFHAMSGREGIIDTSIKTAETGYIQRKFSKSMENIMIYHDKTVRNTKHHIIQFLYGEDGFDPSYIERYVSVSKSCKRITLKLEELLMDKKITDCQLLKKKSFYYLEDNMLAYIKSNYYFTNTISMVPCHISRTMANIIDITFLKYKIRCVRPSIYYTFIYCLVHFIIDNTSSISYKNIKPAIRTINNFVGHVIKNINPGNLEYYGFKNRKLLYCLRKLKHSFIQSLMTPGECVGVIAAQSIGEPTTQMTLNTFHFAGVAEKDVTTGVPRFTEIINCSHEIKVPCSYLCLKNNLRLENESIRFLNSRIKWLSISDLIETWELFYLEKYTGNKINILEDIKNNWLNNYYKDQYINDEYKLCVSLTLSRYILQDKQIKLDYIINKIYLHYSERILVLCNNNSSDIIILKIIIPSSTKSMYKNKNYKLNTKRIKILINDILNLSICGISGIYNCKESNHSKFFYLSLSDYNSKVENIIMFDCLGINLIKTLNFPWINLNLSYCNNIIELFEILGIEAARNVYIKELTKILEFDGSYISFHHLSCLADYVSNLGYLNSVNRFGLKQQASSVLQECSFEETSKTIFKASQIGSVDKLYSLTEQIIFGKMCLMGTNFSSVIDESFYSNKKAIKYRTNKKRCSQINKNKVLINSDKIIKPNININASTINNNFLNLNIVKPYVEWDY